MKPLLVTSGEPAGIGPEICLRLSELEVPFVIMGDKKLLKERANSLNLDVQLIDYPKEAPSASKASKQILVFHIPAVQSSAPGVLNAANARYVLAMIKQATQLCLQGQFSGLVTAPVHKGVINEAGVKFSGHTEYLAELCEVEKVVMMLASTQMKIALATTHLPLSQVPSAINQPLLNTVICKLDVALKQDFNIEKPVIAVTGLNPHAGEMGHLGKEEVEVIEPAIRKANKEGRHVVGPFSADTLFSEQNLQAYDAFLAMYHDQGLPVIKYASFGNAVNVTLGLPIIRTSVDHGTALDIADKGIAKHNSMLEAIKLAYQMAQNREQKRA